MDGCGNFHYLEIKYDKLITVCKKGYCLQDSPPAAGRFSDICLSATVQSCLVGLFLCNSGFQRNFLLHKKILQAGTLHPQQDFAKTALRQLNKRAAFLL